MKLASRAVLLSLVVATSASAHAPSQPLSDTYVHWESGPCTEPVLFVTIDAENVRRHIPATYPGTADEFMSHLVTAPGPDGRPQATVVFTLNRCRASAATTVIGGVAQPTKTATDVAETLVMVMWDGASANGFEFYAFASYVSEPTLAAAYRSLGLPSQHAHGMTYTFDADPEQPAPGAVVPFAVAIPNAFRIEGAAVRPEAYGPAGLATHHYHGARGELWVEHDSPTGGIGGTQATVTVTGPQGAWLADLLGGAQAPAFGLLLEKHVGHAHTAYLLD